MLGLKVARRMLFLASVSILMSGSLFANGAELPEVARLVSEMRETGASVRCGYSENTGVFFVALGRSTYSSSSVDCCRELAQVKAERELSSALQTSIKAHDLAVLQMKQGRAKAEVEAFVASQTEISIKQLLKGVRVVWCGKNAEDEMEVVIIATSRMVDLSDDFQKQQVQWGGSGVVKAIGIDSDRAVAERNALRSAVEQVAGTLVIGKVSVNERDELHRRLATTAGALVEEYRVVHEMKREMQFEIEVLARINKRKLYDNYRSYFKCLDNPTFCIVATDESLVRQFTGFFIEKGFLISRNPGDSTFLIKMDGLYCDRPTPGIGESFGTMLNLNINVVSVDGSRVLLSVNEKQSKDSAVLTAEQRREEVARRIFGKLESRLHQEIQNMVVRMLDDADRESSQEPQSGMAF